MFLGNKNKAQMISPNIIIYVKTTTSLRDLHIFFSELELVTGLVLYMPCVGDVFLSAVFFGFIYVLIARWKKWWPGRRLELRWARALYGYSTKACKQLALQVTLTFIMGKLKCVVWLVLISNLFFFFLLKLAVSFPSFFQRNIMASEGRS